MTTMPLSVVGTSPREWGQRRPPRPHHAPYGNIPTRVGTTFWYTPLAHHVREHPHASGDNDGNPVVDILCVRNIPTRVGTTIMISFKRIPIWEHPHASGDNSNPVPSSKATTGTSPREWGQLGKQLGITAAKGNIPTRVGTTSILTRQGGLVGEHPHASGDNRRVSTVSACSMGNIPTRVGTTQSQMRVRLSAAGTSPREWGQLIQSLQEYGVTRNIPTRVGTTVTITASRFLTREHPHASGDNMDRRFR